MFLFLSFLILTLLLVLCLFHFKNIKYWKDRDVSFKMPLPFFGNMLKSALRLENFVYLVDDLYNKFSDSSYFTFFDFRSPVIVIKDPELIHTVTVKEFDTFPAHQPFTAEDIDPVWAKNIGAVEDPERWRRMRATLSPCFTGSKMRLMFKLMNECAANVIDYYLENKEAAFKIDLKDMFRRYTNDVVASTAFGVACDSTKDRNNQFYRMGKNITDFSGIRAFRFFIYSISPFIAKTFKIALIDRTAAAFFRRVIKESIRLREENGTVRPDMIHLLMEAKKNLDRHEDNDGIDDCGFAAVEESEMIKKEAKIKRELTDDDITSQAIIFFLAGFDTASTLMSFTSTELAANPDIQNRLAEEISEVYRIKGNSPSYEDVINLKYLDMVVTETLRKWPSPLFTNRKSAKTYTLKPPREGSKPVCIPKGSFLWIPIYSIHRDEKYYPNPEVYDPERFSEENKANIIPYTYIPFGMGPRNCIGSRYALMEAKILFYHLLAHFEVVLVEETKYPLRLDNSHLQAKPKGGFILGLKQRKF